MTAEERTAEAYKFTRPFPEVKVTQESRQEGFDKKVTTDDHLMHLTGIVKDQDGTKYYITKNSWGTARNPFGGYLNMSEKYVRAKTIAIMVHKNSIPQEIKTKLGIIKYVMRSCRSCRSCGLMRDLSDDLHDLFN